MKRHRRSARAGRNSTAMVGARHALVGACALMAGCSTLLPRATSESVSPFTTFDSARQAFERIQPYRTTLPELKQLGFDAAAHGNLQQIPYPQFVGQLVPNPVLAFDRLDAGIRDCIDARQDSAKRWRAMRPCPEQSTVRRLRSPAARSAGVDVNEAGCRVVPDAAGAQRQRLYVDRRQRHAGDADVDGPPLQVQAATGDAGAATVQHRIGGGRAIAGNDLERWRAAHALAKRVKQIEQGRVHGRNVAGAEVPQQPVRRVQRVGLVAAGMEVFDGQSLAGVQVRKRKPASRRGSKCVRGHHRSDRGDGGKAEKVAA
jgi:hypothetical protein